MPTPAELQNYVGHTVPDLLGPDVHLLFVGINPGLWTAAAQAHFARRGNRFYPALHRAGIVDRLIDAADGYAPADREHLLARGIGITNLSSGATARADEVDRADLIAGVAALRSLVVRVRPRVVAVLGITAYRIAFQQPKARPGRQPADLAGAQLWVAPNPSGLNAHATPASLAADYREIAVAAGIEI
jgi:TDG/mug DNA glycosylase family protein